MAIRVQILRDIKRPDYRLPFYAHTVRIEYDAKAPRARKTHQLIYQQGPCYGTVGDCCDYLTHDELLELERQGFVRISRS